MGGTDFINYKTEVIAIASPPADSLLSLSICSRISHLYSMVIGAPLLVKKANARIQSLVCMRFKIHWHSTL